MKKTRIKKVTIALLVTIMMVLMLPAYGLAANEDAVSSSTESGLAVSGANEESSQLPTSSAVSVGDDSSSSVSVLPAQPGTSQPEASSSEEAPSSEASSSAQDVLPLTKAPAARAPIANAPAAPLSADTYTTVDGVQTLPWLDGGVWVSNGVAYFPSQQYRFLAGQVLTAAYNGTWTLELVLNSTEAARAGVAPLTMTYKIPVNSFALPSQDCYGLADGWQVEEWWLGIGPGFGQPTQRFAPWQVAGPYYTGTTTVYAYLGDAPVDPGGEIKVTYLKNGVQQGAVEVYAPGEVFAVRPAPEGQTNSNWPGWAVRGDGSNRIYSKGHFYTAGTNNIYFEAVHAPGATSYVHFQIACITGTVYTTYADYEYHVPVGYVLTAPGNRAFAQHSYDVLRWIKTYNFSQYVNTATSPPTVTPPPESSPLSYPAEFGFTCTGAGQSYNFFGVLCDIPGPNPVEWDVTFAVRAADASKGSMTQSYFANIPNGTDWDTHIEGKTINPVSCKPYYTHTGWEIYSGTVLVGTAAPDGKLTGGTYSIESNLLAYATFKAEWPITFSVHDDDAAKGEMTAQRFEGIPDGTDWGTYVQTLTLNTVTEKGYYEHTGWNIYDGTTKVATAKPDGTLTAGTLPINKPLDAYATFALVQHTVTLDVHGINGATGSLTLAGQGIGAPYTISSIDAGTALSAALGGNLVAGAGTGSYFVGWYQNYNTQTESGTFISPQATFPATGDVTSNLSFTAVFSKSIPLTITGQQSSPVYNGTQFNEQRYRLAGLQSGDTLTLAGVAVTADGMYNLPAHMAMGTEAGPYSPGTPLTSAQVVFGNMVPNGKYTVTIARQATLNIQRAPVTITLGNNSKVYGQNDPVPLATVADNKPLQGVDVVYADGALPALTRQAGEKPGENYAISLLNDTVQSLEVLNKNYTFSIQEGVFTLTPFAVTVTAQNAVKRYGQQDPALQAAHVPADVPVLPDGTAFSYSVVRLPGDDVGHYPIIIQGGLAALQSKYAPYLQITYVPAELEILPREVVFGVRSASKIYGDPDPEFSFGLTVAPGAGGGLPDEAWFSALVARPAALLADVQASMGRGALQAARMPQHASRPNVGDTITLVLTNAAGTVQGNGTRGNYTWRINPALLTINPAVLTVTGSRHTVNAGEAIPPLYVTYSGFKNGDNASDLTVRPAAYTVYTQGSAAGQYPVNVSGGQAANYRFRYVAGEIVVNNPSPGPGPGPGPGPSPSSSSSSPPARGVPSSSASSATSPVSSSSSVPPNAASINTGSGSAATLSTGSVPLVTITDEERALTGGGEGLHWALLNLLLSVVCVIVGVIMLITLIGRKPQAGLPWRLLSLVSTILAPIVFVLTQNMKNPMIVADIWTTLHALLLIVQLVFVILLYRARNNEEDEEENSVQEDV